MVDLFAEAELFDQLIQKLAGDGDSDTEVEYQRYMQHKPFVTDAVNHFLAAKNTGATGFITVQSDPGANYQPVFWISFNKSISAPAKVELNNDLKSRFVDFRFDII